MTKICLPTMYSTYYELGIKIRIQAQYLALPICKTYCERLIKFFIGGYILNKACTVLPRYIHTWCMCYHRKRCHCHLFDCSPLLCRSPKYREIKCRDSTPAGSFIV
jgi:hypothetical protein